jgi:hypothetical protein
LSGKKLEERIGQIRSLRTSVPAAGVDVILRKALADRSGLVVAEAARTTADLRLAQLIPDLLTAFDKLFSDPVKNDPKCWGKTAIVKALAQLDYCESPPFFRGSRHVQMEPVYGGQEDSAIHLRANSFLALVQCTDIRRFEILQHLVDAMSDLADPVRVEAVRAIHQLAGDEAVLLLRLKARLGDLRPLIIGHVFDALLSLERDRAVSFVAEHLKSANEEVRDEAALALGVSRLQTGLRALMDAWQETPDGSRDGLFSSVLLRAISSSRLEEAIDFLLELVRSGAPREAAAALEALKIHEDSPEIQARIKHAVQSK